MFIIIISLSHHHSLLLQSPHVSVNLLVLLFLFGFILLLPLQWLLHLAYIFSFYYVNKNIILEGSVLQFILFYFIFTKRDLEIIFKTSFCKGNLLCFHYLYAVKFWSGEFQVFLWNFTQTAIFLFLDSVLLLCLFKRSQWKLGLDYNNHMEWIRAEPLLNVIKRFYQRKGEEIKRKGRELSLKVLKIQ